MNITVEFTLNGSPQKVTTESKRNLLEVLREELKLTGTKYGCGEGECRACTVLLNGLPAKSCLRSISSVQGLRVETIEGLAQDNQLHPVQEAFLAEDAMQCGYCVPGMILTTVALLKKNPQPSRDQIIEALDGNLCRCCGYPNILRAVEQAARRSRKEPVQP